MTSPTPSRAIVLFGFMGAGKTEVGRLVADRLRRPFVDTDDLVERATGRTVAQLFRSRGEAAFRRLEREAVARALEVPGTVVAVGGGAVLDRANIRALARAGVLVHLEVEPKVVVERLRTTTGRPLLAGAADPEARVRELLAERAPTYRRVADVTVDASKPPHRVAFDVIAKVGLRRGRRPPRRVTVLLAPPYDVCVGRGLLARAATLAEPPSHAERICVITHPRLWTLWGEPLAGGFAERGLEIVPITFPPGERRKTPETVSRIVSAMARSRVHRGDLVVALGGGVVGDVAGFAAATYMRGVDVVQVPTSLLAMVDAAIGGKTGVNLAEGKNLVGAFHQPRAVLCDLDVLATLPDREVRGGLAEVVKYALIADPLIGDVLRRSAGRVLERRGVAEELVERSVRVKADVVAADEREVGVRAILNYGHTLGHAIEAASLAGDLPGRTLHHGEAIAVGMHFAARLSVALGTADATLVDAHLELLEAVGLPTRVRRLPFRRVARYMGMDKKYARGARFVLLEDVARPVVHADVPGDAIRAAYDAVTV